MADIELATVNASGDLNSLQLGDVTSGEKVLTQDEVDAKDTTLDNKITALDDRVTDLETNVQFAPYYEYVKVSDVVVVNDTYQQIAQLQVAAEAGTYEYKMSMTYNLNSTNTSAYLRFSTDGGSSWNEFQREPKDNTDSIPMYYEFPTVFAGGTIDIIVEARKENAGDVMNIEFLDIVAERKL